MASSVDIPKNVVFWSGAVAGLTSATTTHFLDVGKVLKQVGRAPPPTLLSPSWTRGLFMGSFAQGQRFATTLLLDATLQQKIKNEMKDYDSYSFKGRILSFGISMFASGLGEFLANPPVAIKNYQIAHNVPCFKQASQQMYAEKRMHSFFRGVGAGVVRKALANAIVLQTIHPVKGFLASHAGLDTKNVKSHAAISGFLAGGLTGGIAEVLTNPWDRVKTLMQANPQLTLREAVLDALRRPFNGAGYAFVRKGSIRAINWGVVGLLTAMYSSTVISMDTYYTPKPDPFPLPY